MRQSIPIARILTTLIALGSCSAKAGTILAASETTDSILRYDLATGTFLGTFITSGSGGLNNIQGMAYGPDGNLYVDSANTNSVLRYDGTTGAFLNTFVTSGSGGLAAPDGLTFGPDGNLYVVSISGSGGVLRYSGATGASLGQFVPGPGSGGNDASLAFGPDGFLYVGGSNGSSGFVNRYDGSTGAFVNLYAGSFTDGALDLLFGSAGQLYVSQFHSNVGVDVVAPGGGVPSILIPGANGLNWPDGTALDGNGNLLVSNEHGTSIGEYNALTGALVGTFASGIANPGALLIQPSPEPGTFLLLGAALFAAGCLRSFVKMDAETDVSFPEV